MTVFLVWQGIAPTLWSGLGDNLGRRLTIIGTLIVFLAANLGLSFADQYGVLVFLRCLQAFGSASVIAVGQCPRRSRVRWLNRQGQGRVPSVMSRLVRTGEALSGTFS